jgi:hypothetical protein
MTSSQRASFTSPLKPLAVRRSIIFVFSMRTRFIIGWSLANIDSFSFASSCWERSDIGDNPVLRQSLEEKSSWRSGPSASVRKFLRRSFRRASIWRMRSRDTP